MNPEITKWAIRNQIPYQALRELQEIFGLNQGIKPDERTALGESGVQSLVRLEAAQKGLKLWRNNVGVLPNENGTPIRYGLGNDSPALNKAIKSGDLIGWRPLFITSEHLGTTVAQFVSRECKRPDWIYTATEREQAQLRWAEVINADGGDACFVTAQGSL